MLRNLHNMRRNSVCDVLKRHWTRMGTKAGAREDACAQWWDENYLGS